MKNVVLCGVLLTALTGCAGIEFVDSSTTTFYRSDYRPNGTLVILPADSSLSESLEFQHYKGIVEGYLQQAGYEITSNFAEADNMAFLSYGIDNGRDRQVPVPIYGQTGGGTTTTIQGTVNTTGTGQAFGSGSTSQISASAYTMPTYGIVGVGSATQRTFRRALAFDIYNLSDASSTQGKVFESRTSSIGRCGNIYEVLDEIIEAAFADFPGESGKTDTERVSGDFNC